MSLNVRNIIEFQFPSIVYLSIYKLYLNGNHLGFGYRKPDFVAREQLTLLNANNKSFVILYLRINYCRLLPSYYPIYSLFCLKA